MVPRLTPDAVGGDDDVFFLNDLPPLGLEAFATLSTHAAQAASRLCDGEVYDGGGDAGTVGLEVFADFSRARFAAITAAAFMELICSRDIMSVLPSSQDTA